ncbi:DNA internalization-related competence protein ComEC/Rec2 [Propionivibrio limicola]|uniref:DNA internalization-related competence protein ComEC/Rec2 n=1 Tax=Propionivibrio limicola TaxID=167645 RepID=UPI001290A4D1|nr:DNA internalization-related competence protein ComEC/Rec2 [Propionivibrio limicola]
MRTFILAFAGGILLLQQQGELPGTSVLWALLGLVLVLVVGAVGAATRRVRELRGAGRSFRVLLLIVCGAIVGFVWAGWRADVRLRDALPEFSEMRDIQVTGVIAALPQRFERGERFEFDVESVNTPDVLVPQRIFLSWYHGWDEPESVAGDGRDESEVVDPVEARAVRPGERWDFTVRLKRPHGNANPHGFDYEARLLERSIRATGTIRARAPMQKREAFVWRPAYVVERLRDTLRSRFFSELPGAPYVGVLAALAIGDQRGIPAAQWQVFNRTGIAHLVSISGLHVTMIAGLFAALINWLWRYSEWTMHRWPAQKAAVVAGALAAFLYALLAGFEVPAQRTFYMLFVVALALLSNRHLGVSRVLALALFTVLLIDPWAILVTGFWLSFGAVAVLFYVSTARVGGSADARGVRELIAQWGAMQWAVTIGSLPLLLFFFQQFSLVSPLANAVAIPVISFVVTPLALVYAVLPWPPLLHFDHWLMTLLMELLDTLATWPLWQQPVPPLWALIVAALGVVWLLLPRGFPARWIGCFLLLPALFLPPPRPPSGEAWVDVLDVGQGLAVAVRTAGHTLLYDTGPLYSAESSAGQRVVVPYLRALGVQRLDALVVSHRDKDHSGGVAAIREALAVDHIISSMTELDGERCVAGQRWEWDGVRFMILHPDAGDYSATGKKTPKPNNLSCVLRIENGRGSVLLAADIETADEKAVIARFGGQLHSDVLQVAHHGGRGSSSEEFIAAVAPAHAVFSAGYRNSFRHPRPEVLERYKSSRHWRTDQDGAVRIVLNAGQAPGVTGWRQESRRYWHQR